MLGAIIADGEELGRHHIRDLLRSHADIEVLRECRDGSATVEATKELNPELLFLAIDMPKLDGFGVLSAVESRPTVILIAAQPQYAVAAFEANVLDYLLKPVRKSRFDEALERARTRIRELEDLARLSANAPDRSLPDRSLLVIKVDGRTLFLPVDAVECIKAERDYVLVCADKAEHLVRETLTSILNRLDQRFLRIHRSAIVNLQHVREVDPLFAGDARLTLASGRQLTLSRTHRQAFEEFMHGYTVARSFPMF
jgi:Response regulator of the LytR/AlgR family